MGTSVPGTKLRSSVPITRPRHSPLVPWFPALCLAHSRHFDISSPIYATSLGPREKGWQSSLLQPWALVSEGLAFQWLLAWPSQASVLLRTQSPDRYGVRPPLAHSLLDLGPGTAWFFPLGWFPGSWEQPVLLLCDFSLSLLLRQLPAPTWREQLCG